MTALRIAAAVVLLSIAALAGCKRTAPAEGPPKAAAVAPSDVRPADVPKPADVPPPDPFAIPESAQAAWFEPPADLEVPPKTAEKSKSGLAWEVLKPGTGTERPTLNDAVLAHYTVWGEDGRRVDTSVNRGKPRVFRVGKTFPGWREGVQLMTVGERRRFWIPEKLGFRGRGGRPDGKLVWQAELLEIRRSPKAPPDVAKPPADATVLPSGLAWKELAPGTGTVHPGATSPVSVHYAGWTTDGVCFDTTLLEGEPALFRLDQVIPGWTEGLQLLVEGQKARFWIPEGLAYAGKPGKPKGMLVFDVELLTVVK